MFSLSSLQEGISSDGPKLKPTATVVRSRTGKIKVEREELLSKTELDSAIIESQHAGELRLAAAAAKKKEQLSDVNDVDVNHAVVHLIKEVGLNFIAFDFDQTILDTHTGGCWGGTSEELATHVRPEMAKLLPKFVHDTENSIHVGVVTFSGQQEMVRDVVQSVVLLETCPPTGEQPQIQTTANNIKSTSKTKSVPIRGED